MTHYIHSDVMMWNNVGDSLESFNGTSSGGRVRVDLTNQIHSLGSCYPF